MNRKEDVIGNFMSLGITQTITSQHIKNIVRYAVGYGFEQGKSFGKYEAYVEKQNEKITEAIIQPENDKVWREKLDNIMKSKDVVPWAQQTAELLGLIAEILLVRKNGD